MRRLGLTGVLAVAASLALSQAVSAAGARGRIAYASAAGSSSQIFTASPSGRGRRQITHDAGGAANPDWSRSGRLIAYDVGGRRLAIASANGAGEHFVSVDISAIDPAWSPDGSKLVFTGVEYDQYGNLEQTSLYVTAANGSGYHRIGDGSEPDWSPRANWIVYRSNPADSDGCAGIWRIHSDGSGNQPVAPGTAKGSSCSGGGFDPSFSPNGRRVAYVSSNGRAIYTIGLGGGGRRRVVRDGRTKHSPTFSPDGRWIAYSSSAGGAGLWIVSARGGRPKRIGAAAASVSWQS